MIARLVAFPLVVLPRLVLEVSCRCRALLAVVGFDKSGYTGLLGEKNSID